MIQTAYDQLKGIFHVVGGTHEVAEFKYLFRNHLDLNDLEFNSDLRTVLYLPLYSIYAIYLF